MHDGHAQLMITAKNLACSSRRSEHVYDWKKAVLYISDSSRFGKPLLVFEPSGFYPEAPQDKNIQVTMVQKWLIVRLIVVKKHSKSVKSSQDSHIRCILFSPVCQKKIQPAKKHTKNPLMLNICKIWTTGRKLLRKWGLRSEVAHLVRTQLQSVLITHWGVLCFSVRRLCVVCGGRPGFFRVI